jgi:hypothetical protein
MAMPLAAAPYRESGLVLWGQADFESGFPKPKEWTLNFLSSGAVIRDKAKNFPAARNVQRTSRNVFGGAQESMF